MASRGMALWVRDGPSSRVHPRIQHLAIHTAEPTGAAGWLIKQKPGQVGHVCPGLRAGPALRSCGWNLWAPSSRPQFHEEWRQRPLRGGANFLPGPSTWAPVGAAITHPCPFGTATGDPITAFAPAE